MPTPAEAKESFPGLARAYSISAQIRYRHRRIDDQQQRQLMQDPDRREIVLRIVAQIPIKGGPDADRTVGPKQNRIAVRRRMRHRLGADMAAGARAIVHHHLLAELARHGGGHCARQHVG